MKKGYDDYGERCLACGCFLAEIDCSTESGWDYDLVCNNPRCKSKRPQKVKEPVQQKLTNAG